MILPARHIRIGFTAGGKLTVEPDIEAVLEDACIFWQVHSDNMLIRYVQIEFESNSAVFFCKDKTKGGSCAPQITRELPPYGPGYADLVIWGQAPDPGAPMRNDKYTVRGFDLGHTEVLALDPRIITTKP